MFMSTAINISRATTDHLIGNMVVIWCMCSCFVRSFFVVESNDSCGMNVFFGGHSWRMMNCLHGGVKVDGVG